MDLQERIKYLLALNEKNVNEFKQYKESRSI